MIVVRDYANKNKYNMETKLNSRTGNFFEVIVKVLQTQEDGSEKKVREVYAIEASSFTEAEASIAKNIAATGVWEIANINPTPYREVFLSNGAEDETSFKAKIEYITIDKKTEKEKRTKVVFLIQASSIKTTQHYVEEIMGRTQIDYRNVAIVKTPVLDVFLHKD